MFSGRQFLQQFLRLRIAGEMLGSDSKGVMERLRNQLRQGDAVEIAGYLLSSALAGGLEKAELLLPHRTGRVEWIEISSKADASLSPAAAARLTQWQAAGQRARGSSVNGPAFWQTAEISECPALIEASILAMAGPTRHEHRRRSPRLGLDVPQVHRRYLPAPVYLDDRFDRTAGAQGWQRRHVIDARQLLGLDRSYKYSQGSMETLAALAHACRSPAVARARLFAWLVFNVLVGNSDAHLKNLSFMVSHEGVQLAPFYDLLSVASYDTPAFARRGWPAQTQLAWPILGVRHFADINRTLLLQAGAALKLARGTADRVLEHLRSRIAQEALALYR